MGLSQGSLIARYVAQLCDMSNRVNNLLTIGSPSMGTEKIPNCDSGILCSILNHLADDAVYFKLAQYLVGPAGYFRDPKQISSYLSDSVFLPYLNNEKTHANYVLNKARTSSLNGFMMVEFLKDTMIYPKETAVFGSYDINGNLLTLEQQPVYTNDSFGL